MSTRDPDWLDLISRLTDAGVLLLNGSGGLITADERALRLFDRSAPDLVKDWRSVAPQSAEWCAETKNGDDVKSLIELSGESAKRSLQVRVLRLQDSSDARCVALVTEAVDPPAELTAFARRLGHDLRGPLNAMVLNLDLIRLSVEDTADDDATLAKRKRYLGNLQREIDRMSEALTAAVEQVKRGAP